jgi:hypothetical protein
LAAAGIVAYSSSAAAIPAFARRYEATCQTCHTAFPKLTPFGEAFRRNAYRFPLGGDETAEKEDPITLGSEAHKDLWPRAVSPGQIARTAPLSVVTDFRAEVGSKLEGHTVAEGAHGSTSTSGDHSTESAAHGSTTLTFGQVGGQARVLAGGSMGKIGGYFAAISFGGHAPVEVERGFVIVTPMSQTSLLIKMGRFEPSLHGVSIHRGMLGHQLRLTTTPVLANSYTPEPSLRGFELSGLIWGRVGWTAGMVENTLPIAGLGKDYYGRLEIKRGGMRLDGAYSEAGAAAWSERSVTLGVSAYRGKSFVTDTLSMPGMAMTYNDPFLRVGADIHLIFDNLLADAVVAVQRHEGSVVPDQITTLQMAYAELTYVIFPWLFPTVRAEVSRLTNRPAPENDPRWIAIAALSAMVRPNLLMRVEGAGGADPGDHIGFRFAALNLSTAF